MNPENPSREEIELKLSALLLGELPDDEAKLLRYLIAQDATLKKLHDELASTIVLVREAEKTPAENAPAPIAPLKLSETKREKLLAHFKTLAPKEFLPLVPPLKKRNEMPSLLAIAAMLAIIAVLAAMLLPSLSAAKRKAQRVTMLSGQMQMAQEDNKSLAENSTAPAAPQNERRVDALEAYVQNGNSTSEPNAIPVTQQTQIVLPGAGNSVENKQLVAEDSWQNNSPSESYGQRLAQNEFAQPAQPNLDDYKLVPQTPHQLDPPPLWIRKSDGARAPSDVAKILDQENSSLLNASASSDGNKSQDVFTTRATQNNSSPQTDAPTFAFNARAGGFGGDADGRINGGGGFYRNTETTSDSLETPQSALAPNQNADKLPMLGDSPVVGNVFSSKSENRIAEINGTASDGEVQNNLTFNKGAIQPGNSTFALDGANTYNDDNGAAAISGGILNGPVASANPSGVFPIAAPAAPTYSFDNKANGMNFDDADISGNNRIISQTESAAIAEKFQSPAPATFQAQLSQQQIASGSSATSLNASKKLAADEFASSQIAGVVNNTPLLAAQVVMSPTTITRAMPVLKSTAGTQGSAGDSSITYTNVQMVFVGGMPFTSTVQVATAPLVAPPTTKELVDEDRALPKIPQSAPIPQPEFFTRENSFSTFSLNVSDVSFKLAAASLERGQLPDAASIRSEEFINAFNYHDPEPAAGVPVAFVVGRARDPFAHNRDLLRFSVKTAALGREAGRPLNIVLLLDNSGSMERADRVKIIHEALRVLAAQLQPQDTLSIVTFARTARLWVDGARGDQAGVAVSKVSDLTPEGGTNLEEAMKLAYATALRHYLTNGGNRVVLLTDGAANLGNVDPEALKQKVESFRKQGIALDCFGIGWEGYNDDLLEQLSSNGDGRYAFLNSTADATDEFAAKLAGALHVAAEDVKVQVEFNPQRVISWRQIGYAKHQLTKEQFRDNTVAAAPLAAREAGNALYTVEINPDGTGPVATVRVRFRIPGTQDVSEHEWQVPFDGTAPALENSSSAMRLAATAAEFSEWLAASPFAQEVTPDGLQKILNGVPQIYDADARPKQLETMLREAKSISGK